MWMTLCTHVDDTVQMRELIDSYTITLNTTVAYTFLITGATTDDVDSVETIHNVFPYMVNLWWWGVCHVKMCF